MRFISVSKCSKFNVDPNNVMKNWQKVFGFSDNCISIGDGKFSVLLREYSKLVVNVLTIENSLVANLKGPYCHTCSVETIGFDVAIFRNSILTLSVMFKRMPKEIFIVRNRITLQAAILNRSEAAVHSHPFSKISPENTGGRVLLLSKLQSDCSE